LNSAKHNHTLELELSETDNIIYQMLKC